MSAIRVVIATTIAHRARCEVYRPGAVFRATERVEAFLAALPVLTPRTRNALTIDEAERALKAEVFKVLA